MIPKNPGVAKKIIPKNPGIAQKGTQKSGSNLKKVPKIMAHPCIATYASYPPPPTRWKYKYVYLFDAFSYANRESVWCFMALSSSLSVEVISYHCLPFFWGVY